jgi:hypothetical protein
MCADMIMVPFDSVFCDILRGVVSHIVLIHDYLLEDRKRI